MFALLLPFHHVLHLINPIEFSDLIQIKTENQEHYTVAFLYILFRVSVDIQYCKCFTLLTALSDHYTLIMFATA